MKEYVVYEKPLPARPTVEMFLDEIHIPITIGSCGPGAGYKFCASLEGCETKQDRYDKFLRSTTGFGMSPKEACTKFLEELQGKLLIIDAMSVGRKEISVPYFSNIDVFVDKLVQK